MMKLDKKNNLLLSAIFFIFSLSMVGQNTDCDATILEDFFSCYGGADVFSEHAVDAISTFIEAENAIAVENYTQAQSLINELFTTYPTGDAVWGSVLNTPNGANVGSPNAYYGLRMMEDIVDFHLTGEPA